MKETGREGGEISYQHFIEAVEKVREQALGNEQYKQNVVSRGGLRRRK